MFGTAILDATIGLVFVYLILSLICSAVQEFVARFAKLRSKNLKSGIENLLKDPNIQGLSTAIYDHPLIKKLAKEGKDPSYIPARTFATVLFDTLKEPSKAGSGFQQAASSVANLPDGEIKTALAALIDDAQGNVEAARKNVEDWFDDAMDRVSGWYKRRTQTIMIFIALGITGALNVDSIEVAKRFWQEPVLREMVAKNAEKFAGSKSTDLSIKDLQEKLADQSLPIGWPQLLERYDTSQRNSEELKIGSLSIPGSLLIGLQTFVGWLLTILAVSLGAPFWFDTLQKFLSIRAAGKKPTTGKPA